MAPMAEAILGSGSDGSPEHGDRSAASPGMNKRIRTRNPYPSDETLAIERIVGGRGLLLTPQARSKGDPPVANTNGIYRRLEGLMARVRINGDIACMVIDCAKLPHLNPTEQSVLLNASHWTDVGNEGDPPVLAVETVVFCNTVRGAMHDRFARSLAILAQARPGLVLIDEPLPSALAAMPSSPEERDALAARNRALAIAWLARRYQADVRAQLP